jgi:O-antigen/teichoic acid export membrane protein
MPPLKQLIDKHGAKLLYAATIGALGLSFFGSVLNSRLLSKESFGDWKYLQNFIILISYLVNFGLYSSGGRLIAATNDAKKIRTYKGYLLYFAIGGLAVILITTLVVGFLFPRWLNASLFKLAILMFPLFLVNPLNFYFEACYQGERKMLHMAIFRFAPPLTYVVLLYAFNSFSSGSIYYNAFLYYGSYFFIYLFLLWSDKPIFKKGTSEWKDLQLQHKSFGIQVYWGSLWGVGIIYMLPLLVGYFNINNVEVGHYSLALSFIMPLSILPGIVGTSNYKSYITLPTIPKNNFKKVILASVSLQVALILGVDFIIDFFLGEKYKEVSFLIKIGSFGAILHGFGDFVNKFLLAKGESKYLKKVSIAVGIVQLVSSLILIKLYSATGGIIAKSLGSLVFFAVLFYFYYKKYVVEGSEGIKIVTTEAAPTEKIPAE